MLGIKDTKDGKFLENTGGLYNEIATNYPSNNYTHFCHQLGVKYARAQRILIKHLKDYEEAVKEVLNIWEAKGNATRSKLESALEKADTGALCTIVAKHFANDAVREEEEESDEDAPSGTRQRRGRNEVHKEEEESDESDEDKVNEEAEEYDESDEEHVTVRQSGGPQTINASGRAKVKGSTMTGPVTNMTIHNHHAEASTSQRQGRKRKAAASSGGKKGRKVGRKR